MYYTPTCSIIHTLCVYMYMYVYIYIYRERERYIHIAKRGPDYS